MLLKDFMGASPRPHLSPLFPSFPSFYKYLLGTYQMRCSVDNDAQNIPGSCFYGTPGSQGSHWASTRESWKSLDRICLLERFRDDVFTHASYKLPRIRSQILYYLNLTCSLFGAVYFITLSCYLFQ